MDSRKDLGAHVSRAGSRCAHNLLRNLIRLVLVPVTRLAHDEPSPDLFAEELSHSLVPRLLLEAAGAGLQRRLAGGLSMRHGSFRRLVNQLGPSTH
jgi:hypothetical protein